MKQLLWPVNASSRMKTLRLLAISIAFFLSVSECFSWEHLDIAEVKEDYTPVYFKDSICAYARKGQEVWADHYNATSNRVYFIVNDDNRKFGSDKVGLNMNASMLGDNTDPFGEKNIVGSFSEFSQNGLSTSAPTSSSTPQPQTTPETLTRPSTTVARGYSYKDVLEVWDKFRSEGIIDPNQSLRDWCQHMNTISGSYDYSAGLNDGPWIRFYTRTEERIGSATPFVIIGALASILLSLLWGRYLLSPVKQLLAMPTNNRRGTCAPGESVTPPPPEIATPTITPASFFLCVLMALPALLAAKIATHGFFDPFIAGFYGGSNRQIDETYYFLTQFVSCALGGFIFVWVGALCTKRIRSFSVWFFATFAVLAALGLGDMNGMKGLFGQVLGALGAAFIFWKK